MIINPIENGETGFSVREKLNRVLGLVYFEVVLAATTDDNTQTELFIVDDSEPRMVIPVNKAWAFDILMMGYGGNNPDVWRIVGGIHNVEGTVIMAKSWDATDPLKSTFGKYDPAKAILPIVTTSVLVGDQSKTWATIVVDEDTDNSSLRIRVTQNNYDPGYVFEWIARASIIEVTYTPPS